MHKLLLAVLCWLLAGQNALAQEDSLPLILPTNEWYLKLSPFSFVESDGGIAFSGEYILVKKKLGLQLEMQPVFFSSDNTDGQNGLEAPVNTLRTGMPLGIKLRPEIRFYVDGLRSEKYHPKVVLDARGNPLPRREEARSYVAIDLLYKYIQREREGNFTINNGGTTPAYQQTAIYTDIKQVLGFDFKIGTMVPLFRSRHWFAETYIGFGFRFKSFGYKNLPVGASDPARNAVISLGRPDIDNNPGATRTGISLPAGVKIVYRLK